MARRFLTGPLLASFIACGIPAASQSAPPVQSSEASTYRIALGQSSLPLNGPWRFQIGDSPLDPDTGKSLWAEPGFNDSNWSLIDLTPPADSYNPAMGTSGFVSGWMQRGHPGYAGFAWYRLRIQLQPENMNSPAGLALKMPAKFDDAYQVFANGQLMGEFGHFIPAGVKMYSSQPRAFFLPAGSNRGQVTIAIRMWMDPSTTFGNPSAGGLHGPPVLGQAPVIMAMQVLARKATLRFFASYSIEFVIILLAIGVTVVLYRLDRSETAFPLLGITCGVILVYVSAFLVKATTAGIDERIVTVIINLMGALVPPLWIVFWATWLRLDGMRRLHRIVWPLAILLFSSWTMLAPPLFGHIVPLAVGVWISGAGQLFSTILETLLLWVAFQGLRKNRIEGLLALPAILLIVFGHLDWLLRAVHLPTEFHPFGILVLSYQPGTGLSLCMVTVQLLHRFYRNQRERDQWRQEMEQARQVQQMLLPEALPTHSGFVLESEYRPALEVGGDFFQILPSADGGLLVIIGDVSGKGLKAAMLVAMIVGAIRTIAEHTHEPLEILQGLNRRLCGRLSHQFATCLAIRIAAAGNCIAANAGHLAPYLNGREVALAGSVPLGLVEGSEFEQVSFALEPGNRLVLITDGIVEAQDSQQQLFGFARTTELVEQSHSAAEVATTAQHFGQEDDISVISVTRTQD
jgi:hypothetical protein